MYKERFFFENCKCMCLLVNIVVVVVVVVVKTRGHLNDETKQKNSEFIYFFCWSKTKFS